MTPSFPKRIARISALSRAGRRASDRTTHPKPAAGRTHLRERVQESHERATDRSCPGNGDLALNLTTTDLLSQHDDLGFIPLFEVLRHLQVAGIVPVVIGGVALSCWSGRPRTSAEHDLVVASAGHKQAQTVLQAAYPHLELVSAGCAKDAVRFIASTPTGIVASTRIEVIADRAPLHRLAMEHAVTIRVAGGQVRLPTPEALLVLKTAAAASITRQAWARRQDEADIALLIESCPWMQEAEILALAKAISPEFCTLTREVVRECRELA